MQGFFFFKSNFCNWLPVAKAAKSLIWYNDFYPPLQRGTLALSTSSPLLGMQSTASSSAMLLRGLSRPSCVKGLLTPVISGIFWATTFQELQVPFSSVTVVIRANLNSETQGKEDYSQVPLKHPYLFCSFTQGWHRPYCLPLIRREHKCHLETNMGNEIWGLQRSFSFCLQFQLCNHSSDYYWAELIRCLAPGLDLS